MGRDTGRLREEVTQALLAAGAAGVGFAKAGPVSDAAFAAYNQWLASGHAAGMAYLHNHIELRRDPRLLLEGSRTVITMAFSYRSAAERDPQLPRIALYALLPDYHDAIRKIVRASAISRLLGEELKSWRLCIDSAPVMERYWAVRSGLGTLCDNGAVSVGRGGSEVILAEILTTEAFEPGVEMAEEGGTTCTHCGACRRACPTGALGNGEIDCDRCLSYLTIEHRGEWEDPRHREAMATAAGRQTLFGCDRCISRCPLNRQESNCRAFADPLEGITGLSAADLLRYDDETRARLSGSSLKRAKEEGLKRNAANTDY